MVEMKCENCGAKLVSSNGAFFCEYCHSTFYSDESAFPIDTNCVISGGRLLKYNGAEPTVYIPQNVYVIGANAFAENLFVKKVVFSHGVHTVETGAFRNCRNLTEIENYQSIRVFQDECFCGAGLNEVVIGNEVLTLGKFCFGNMPNLHTVYYYPHKNFKLNHTFAKCPNLARVEMDRLYFFPWLTSSLQVRHNPQNTRPTYFDAFWGTPYFTTTKATLLQKYKQGICPECGGRLKKRLFHAKCQNCGIDCK